METISNWQLVALMQGLLLWSGIPHDMLQEDIKRGVCKINLSTEIKNIFMKTFKNKLPDEDEINLRKVFPVATAAII